ncbi:MAG: GAF domain-containing protein [Prevotellaceae bacterium]|jgi:GAF domain-containing protein|nr:GAF domain-containing protein [Prevotellaceae bacterium]
MAEIFSVTGASKEEKYRSLLAATVSMVQGETDIIANMANITAIIKEVFDFLWVGFYRVTGDELVLGPFQGPVACTRIKKAKGVCGLAWEKAENIIVPDVDKFPGHISCSPDSKSEIVIPVFKNNEIIGVLDIDSEYLNKFDETDEKYLSQIVDALQKQCVFQ